MWLLINQVTNEKFYLKPNKTITVGRKNTDIVLSNDASISRNHASICVNLKEHMNLNDLLSTCVIKDLGSKYGTFIIRKGTEIKVTTEGHEVKPYDIIRIGLTDKKFSVEYIKFVTVVSAMSPEEKILIKDIIDKIGGSVIDYYDENCTHLTVATGRASPKVIRALVNGIPIIDSKYWKAVLNCINENNELPDAKQFILPCTEVPYGSKDSFQPIPGRKEIFKNKTFFFFMKKQYNEYKYIIKEAGGKAVLYSENVKFELEDFFQNDMILIQVNADTQTQADSVTTFYDKLTEKMKAKDLRPIGEREIAIAIFMSSLVRYCNPKYKFQKILQKKTVVKDESEILVLDTQDLSEENKNTKTAAYERYEIIPESENSFSKEANSENFEIQAKNLNAKSKNMEVEPSNGDLKIKSKTEILKSEKTKPHNLQSPLKRNASPEEEQSSSGSEFVKPKISKTDDVKEQSTVQLKNNKKLTKQNDWISRTPIEKKSVKKHNFDDDFEDEPVSFKRKNSSKEETDKKIQEWGFKLPQKDPESDFDDDFEMEDVKPVFSKENRSSNMNKLSTSYLKDSEKSKNRIQNLLPVDDSNLIRENNSAKFKAEDQTDSSSKNANNYKQFKKNSVSYPRKRLGLEDMEIWQP